MTTIGHQDPPPPPPPLRPPPKPPKPPPKPPPPPPNPPPKPPPKGPTPLVHPAAPAAPLPHAATASAAAAANRVMSKKRMNSARIRPLPPPRCCARRDTGACGTPCRLTPRPFGDAADEPRHARGQAGAVVAALELRDHDGAGGLAGEAVGDELLEVVAHLDPTRRFFTASSTSRPLSRPCSPTPLPRFSNIFTAYSRMSPYGSKVSTVATTTTSPLAAAARGSARPCALRSAASMTPAKSLTGCVSAGGRVLRARPRPA